MMLLLIVGRFAAAIIPVLTAPSRERVADNIMFAAADEGPSRMIRARHLVPECRAFLPFRMPAQSVYVSVICSVDGGAGTPFSASGRRGATGGLCLRNGRRFFRHKNRNLHATLPCAGAG
jgi:hypothetical protein